MHLDLGTGCADPFHWAVTMDGTGPAKNGSGLLKAQGATARRKRPA